MAQRKKAKRDHEKNQPHEAIAMLRADHQRVRDLFQEYQAATDPQNAGGLGGTGTLAHGADCREHVAPAHPAPEHGRDE
jgi:hypothetical protein